MEEQKAQHKSIKVASSSSSVYIECPSPPPPPEWKTMAAVDIAEMLHFQTTAAVAAGKTVATKVIELRLTVPQTAAFGQNLRGRKGREREQKRKVKMKKKVKKKKRRRQQSRSRTADAPLLNKNVHRNEKSKSWPPKTSAATKKIAISSFNIISGKTLKQTLDRHIKIKLQSQRQIFHGTFFRRGKPLLLGGGQSVSDCW